MFAERFIRVRSQTEDDGVLGVKSPCLVEVRDSFFKASLLEKDLASVAIRFR